MEALISVIDASTGTATDEEMLAVDRFNERLRAEGRLVHVGGLEDVAQAVVVDNRGGAGAASDGPVVHSLEHVTGAWVVRADDVAHARALAADASLACNRRVELRCYAA